MKLGTDFSGIGAPEMALKYMGIDFESVFACEIDKYARKSFEQLHNPQTFYNDITTRNHKEVTQLDLYVAGFPCQSFSIAGKRKGFDETRGTLFFNVADFIKQNQPKCFVLENVKGLISHDKGRTFQTIVDVLSNGGGTQNGQISLDFFEDGLGYHIYWQVLNTKNFGIPQNRERIFIVGFKDFRPFTFPKEIELELELKDILEDEVSEKYYLSDKIIASFFKHKERHKEKGTGFQWHPKYKEDVANYLRAATPDCPTDNTIIVHSTQKRSPNRPSLKKNKNAGGSGHLCKNDGTTYSLDTANTQAIELRQVGNIDTKGHNSLWGRVYDPEGIASNLNAEGGGLGAKTGLYEIDSKIRRLTPLECWRLQGFRDEDFHSVKDLSDTQLYRQAGNSITVDVLIHLFRKIYG